MERKTGKTLSKEYRSLLSKVQRFEGSVLQRTEELVRQYPDVQMNGDADHKKPITVSDYFKEYNLHDRCQVSVGGEFVTRGYLRVIETIEKWIADQHPHQQQDLPFSNN